MFEIKVGTLVMGSRVPGNYSGRSCGHGPSQDSTHTGETGRGKLCQDRSNLDWRDYN